MSGRVYTADEVRGLLFIAINLSSSTIANAIADSALPRLDQLLQSDG